MNASFTALNATNEAFTAPPLGALGRAGAAVGRVLAHDAAEVGCRVGLLELLALGAPLAGPGGVTALAGDAAHPTHAHAATHGAALLRATRSPRAGAGCGRGVL